MFGAAGSVAGAGGFFFVLLQFSSAASLGMLVLSVFNKIRVLGMGRLMLNQGRGFPSCACN